MRLKLSEKDIDSADVKITPPLIPLGFIIVGYFFDKYIYHLDIPIDPQAGQVIAYVFMFLAIILFTFSLYFFIKTQQNPEPKTPTHCLYTKGIFSLTRNPIYLGFIFAQIVVAIKFDNLYIILFIPLVIVMLNKWVIVPEEKYLEKLFTNDYKAYKQKVRRWL